MPLKSRSASLSTMYTNLVLKVFIWLWIVLSLFWFAFALQSLWVRDLQLSIVHLNYNYEWSKRLATNANQELTHSDSISKDPHRHCSTSYLILYYVFVRRIDFLFSLINSAALHTTVIMIIIHLGSNGTQTSTQSLVDVTHSTMSTDDSLETN